MSSSTNNQNAPTEPTQQSVRARTLIEEANAANASRGSSSADSTYQREWKKFKTFVEEKRNENILPPGPCYLTRDSVDLYFATVVAKLKVHPKTARRIRPSLQFYADHDEHTRRERFVIQNRTVEQALKSQVSSYKEGKKNEFIDPHTKIPIMMISPEEHHAFFDYVYKNNIQHWQSLVTSWNIGCNAYIRMSTFLKFPLHHLRLDKNHGPVKQGSQSRVLCYILTPFIRKEGNKIYSRIRVSGCYRHKTYYQCATGSLAMALFTRLRRDTSLCFNQKDINGVPTWFHRLMFNDWADSKTANTAYKRILDAVGISWGRVVHLRIHGIEYGSTEGLCDEDVASISKHNEDGKLGKVYMTELRPIAMKVMAGFSKDETYFVPRTLLNLPWTDDECCRFLFPQIDTWREQSASINGDDSEAARNVLLHVLPFLAHVAVQDGIYYIRDYPNHEISIYLRDAMPPNYERWAKDARSEVQQIERAHLENFAGCQSHTKIHQAFTNVEMKLMEIEVKQNKMASMQEEMSKMLEGALNYGTITGGGRVGEQNNIGINRLQQPWQYPQLRWNPAQSLVAASTIGGIAFPSQQGNLTQARIQQRTITSALRNTPRVPVFPNQLPDSVERLLLEHEVIHKLTEYDNMKMSGWPQKVKQAFGRRKYLYKAVKNRAEKLRQGDFEQRKVRAAKEMDVERERLGGLSVYKYMLYLKGQK